MKEARVISFLKNYTEVVKCADKAENLKNMKRQFDVFIKEVIFDGERFLIIMKTTDEPLDPEKRQKEEATRKKFELLRFGDPIGIRTRVTAVKGRCLRPLDHGAMFLHSLYSISKVKRNCNRFDTKSWA